MGWRESVGERCGREDGREEIVRKGGVQWPVSVYTCEVFLDNLWRISLWVDSNEKWLDCRQSINLFCR